MTTRSARRAPRAAQGARVRSEVRRAVTTTPRALGSSSFRHPRARVDPSAPSPSNPRRNDDAILASDVFVPLLDALRSSTPDVRLASLRATHALATRAGAILRLRVGTPEFVDALWSQLLPTERPADPAPAPDADADAAESPPSPRAVARARPRRPRCSTPSARSAPRYSPTGRRPVTSSARPHDAPSRSLATSPSDLLLRPGVLPHDAVREKAARLARLLARSLSGRARAAGNPARRRTPRGAPKPRDRTRPRMRNYASSPRDSSPRSPGTIPTPPPPPRVSPTRERRRVVGARGRRSGGDGGRDGRRRPMMPFARLRRWRSRAWRRRARRRRGRSCRGARGWIRSRRRFRAGQVPDAPPPTPPPDEEDNVFADAFGGRRDGFVDEISDARRAPAIPSMTGDVSRPKSPGLTRRTSRTPGLTAALLIFSRR